MYSTRPLHVLHVIACTYELNEAVQSEIGKK